MSAPACPDAVAPCDAFLECHGADGHAGPHHDHVFGPLVRHTWDGEKVTCRHKGAK